MKNEWTLKFIVFKTFHMHYRWKYFCERKRQRRIYEKSTLCSPWQPMLLNTPYVRTGVVNPITIYKKQCILSRNTGKLSVVIFKIFLMFCVFLVLLMLGTCLDT